ncbi:hypothetical protein LCGC14_1760160, partial [marine sediment metagenome]
MPYGVNGEVGVSPQHPAEKEDVMVALKDAIRRTKAAVAGRDIAAGFNLPKPKLVKFTSALNFLKRDDAAAKDVTQEVFVKGFRAAPSFRQDARLSTWLYRIAVNQALRFRHRSAQIQRRTEPTLLDENQPSTERAPDGTRLDVE